MNKDYKRWTERAKDGSPALITERIFYEIVKSQGQGRKYYFADNGDVLDIVTRYLAELEDKKENGTLIELPCNVGDTFYKTMIEALRIDEFVVKRICFQDICPYRYVMGERVSDRAWVSFYLDDFGRTAFLTKSEAEAKLRELKGERQ